jgi:ribosomal protein S25
MATSLGPVSQSSGETGVTAYTPPQLTGHEKHCFIVMPSGQGAEEKRWFQGWYEVVIKPVVEQCGYEAILAAAEQQPGAINDEIRTHLAQDPMVVVDLGGFTAEEPPNPNVMYELGIRHALGLPLVIMAWKGQDLPFDINNQRAIMEDRQFLEIETNRKKLAAFIKSASDGKYYKPMDAVKRYATMEVASTTLSEDSLLRALTQEVRDLRNAITSVTDKRPIREWQPKVKTIKHIIRGSLFRKELYPHFVAANGSPSKWPYVLKAPATDAMTSWTVDEWKQHFEKCAKEFPVEAQSPAIDEKLILMTKELLPPQPWPTGIHRVIAEKLSIQTSIATKCIRALIERGDFQNQIDGKIVDISDEDDGEPAS